MKKLILTACLASLSLSAMDNQFAALSLTDDQKNERAIQSFEQQCREVQNFLWDHLKQTTDAQTISNAIEEYIRNNPDLHEDLKNNLNILNKGFKETIASQNKAKTQ